MMKRRNLHKYGKLVFIALIIFLVGFVIYGKPKDAKEQGGSSERETIFTSAQTDDGLEDSKLNDDILNDSIVKYAVELLDTPYVTAGSGKDGFDCSGYIYFVFQHFDIDVPRSTSGYKNYGTEIPIESVEKGDLLLFLSPTRNTIGHIGIVSDANGTESDFIHATSGSAMKVVITNLSNEGYTRRFVKAIRVT